VEDLSHLTAKSLTFGSMAASNTMSATVQFQPPGSPSESVLEADIRPEMPPIPPTAPRFIAGPGDKGGVLHGTGADPFAGHAWASVASRPGDGRWTTAVPVADDRI
jgi:hypothetical protein